MEGDIQMVIIKCHECGHIQEYESEYPEIGDTIRCVKCNGALMVTWELYDNRFREKIKINGCDIWYHKCCTSKEEIIEKMKDINKISEGSNENCFFISLSTNIHHKSNCKIWGKHYTNNKCDDYDIYGDKKGWQEYMENNYSNKELWSFHGEWILKSR